MNRFVLISVFTLNALFLASQNSICNNKLDSNEVIKIAKRKDAYWTEHWAFQPRIKFDQASCEWFVESTKVKHSKKGNCKHTNGCTEITKVKLVIDAGSKKVKSRKVQKELRPNYE